MNDTIEIDGLEFEYELDPGEESIHGRCVDESKAPHPSSVRINAIYYNGIEFTETFDNLDSVTRGALLTHYENKILELI